MNHLLEDMFAPYRSKERFSPSLAFREIAQNIVLSALSQTGFYGHAAFYGGTCLRIFHHLDRFSEDLDFGLTHDDPTFALSAFLPAVDKTFASLGLAMKASIREKSVQTNVESAFVDGVMHEILLDLFPESEEAKHIIFNQRIKVKFEVSERFVSGAQYEYKTLLLPYYSRVKCFDLPSLFAGKIAAVLGRNWKNRVKGRDYYDFAFYVARGIKPNMDYLKNQLVCEKRMNAVDLFDPETLLSMLRDKFLSVDFDQAKKDVFPFIEDEKRLNDWSQEYFLELLNHLFAE